MDDQQLLLHHLLQKYLGKRFINFITVNLGCLHQLFSWVTCWQGVGVGGKLSRAIYLARPHAENFRENGESANFITSSTSEIFSWKRYKLYLSQSEMLTSNVELCHLLARDGGQAVLGGLSCPRPPNPRPQFQREWIISNFYYIIFFRNI